MRADATLVYCNVVREAPSRSRRNCGCVGVMKTVSITGPHCTRCALAPQLSIPAKVGFARANLVGAGAAAAAAAAGRVRLGSTSCAKVVILIVGAE